MGGRTRCRGVVPVLLVAVVVLAGCGRKVARPDPAPSPDPVGGAPIRPHAPDPERDGGPAIPPDVSRVKEPVPKPEPPARYGNKSPYTVLGKTYRVLPTSKGYVERGIASWYGTKFHGRLTSSREPYDMYQLTAAHKTLPLPTFVRVTNLENGRSIVVRVNDRGPFHDDRIIDLSYAAAVQLGIHLRGTGRVEVRAIDPGDPDDRALAAVDRPATGAAPPRAGARKESWILQLGSFASRDNAKRLKDRVEDADVDDVYLDRERVGGRTVHRVRVGPLRGEETDRVLAQLRRLGIQAVRLSAE